MTLSPARDVAFPLLLRVPAWAAGAELTVNDTVQTGVRPGTFHRVERTWKAPDRVQLRFPMQVRASRWYNESTSLERGPLVFSLKIGEDWKEVKQRMQRPAIPPAKDWEVHPTTPWNYGLAINDAVEPAGIDVAEKPIGPTPFSPAGAPVQLRVKGRRLPEWVLVDGSAGAPPKSPAPSSSPVETLTLIPYGSAKLRITAFPRVTP